MESAKALFLQALRASLENKTVDWDFEMTPELWKALFSMASAHHVLPMVYEAVIGSSSARKTDPIIFAAARKQTLQLVVLQAMKTNDFLNLLPQLISAGVTPLVVKGIICRQLYPNPDSRISADEDILIPEYQFAECHETMLACGMELKDPEQDLNDYEIPYHKMKSHLYIELHKQLFPPESDAYGEFNCFFEGVHDRAVIQTIQGIPVPTMEHTDHLFYLICHAFKHFLHSGFGIRQVCDICLYANAFGSQADWLRIRKQCEAIHADLFTAALFSIAEKHLTFDPDAACYPDQWRQLAVDETPMLEDLLASGVYGASSMSRKHSSNMTLQAVSSRKQGKKGGNGILKSLFPPAKDLFGRYPYLKERPYLLPLAWTDRIVKYRKETAPCHAGNNAVQSLKIGNSRIELLRQYGIID